jgi:hypothetical protein
MPKVLCIAGAVVAILLALVFVLDMSIGYPFRMPSGKDFMESFWIRLPEVVMIVCAGVLGYLSWATYRQLG